MPGPNSSGFFAKRQSSSSKSAAAVVPHIVSLVQPKSVVDVGCGSGTWTAEFVRHEVAYVLGVDGDYVDRSLLAIQPQQFLSRDLEKPLGLGRTFDLAVSLEVAEHLTPQRAASFVEELSGLAPVILFSAATPGQGGTHHLHERWQGYWSRLFAGHGYRTADCLRARFWNDPAVGLWYRQNMLLYIREDQPREDLWSRVAACAETPLDIVHPDLFLRSSLVHRFPTLGFLMRSLPGALRRSMRRRLFGEERPTE